MVLVIFGWGSGVDVKADFKAVIRPMLLLPLAHEDNGIMAAKAKGI